MAEPMEVDAAHWGPPGWPQLPAELLREVARRVAGADELALTKTLLRLVCTGLAVPAKIWRWEEAMQRALAPHAQHIEVLAPLPALSDSPLPQLAACRRLRRLALRHIHAAALPALGALGGLESLDAHVFFPAALDGWLDWAAGLRSLQDLRLTAAVLRLQAEDGLAALLPLKATLRELRLDGCVLLTDTGAAVLAQLRAVTRLEVTCCQAGQAGLDALSAGLPHLEHAELRLLDAVAAGDLQARLGAAGGGLTAHASRAKANTLVGAAGQSMAGVARLAVQHTGCGFVLTAAPTFHLLAGQLTSLSLPRIQLPPGAAVQLAACTALRELEAELAFTVRDADLRAWTALGDMRSLRLAGNFYLSEEAISTVLAAMPRLRLLRLETVQGGGGMLAPLAQLRGVRVLELAGCHLNCAAALRAALCSASGLTHLRVHSCGIQSEVCSAVVAALQALPGMRELELGLRRVPDRGTAEALAVACAGCTQLTALDIHVVGYARDAPAVPAWGRLAALTGLRRLHASTGVGWDREGFAAVAAAATGLRELALTDNAAHVVTPDWAAALAPQQQLTLLQLNSCTALGAEAASLLGQLRSLTGLQIFRCPRLGTEEALHQLRDALPSLATLTTQE